MNLKIRVPYKPGTSSRLTRAGNSWAGRPLLERQLLDGTTTQRQSKKMGSLIQVAKTVLFHLEPMEE